MRVAGIVGWLPWLTILRVVMTNTTLRMGLVGPGFIAPHHIDAVRRLGHVEVVALAGSSRERAQRKAAELGVPKAYGSYQELIADPDIDVVHVTTPNALHAPVSLAAIHAGKHVVCDKPLASSVVECAQLASAAEAASVVNAVTFNHRGYPMAQQMRAMVAAGDVGEPGFVRGSYLQDWMTSDRVYSWRMDPKIGGPSSALADIGSHWCDLAQHVVGSRITAVFADLATIVGTRSSSGASAEAFAEVNEQSVLTPVRMEAEDVGTVLLRFASGARGAMTVGQVLPGHKNELKLEINGREASLGWNSERAEDLWIGHHDRANELMVKDPALLRPEARRYAHLPAGHYEAWPNAFRNIMADIYAWVRSGDARPAQGSTVCTFGDATQVAAVIEAMLESHRTQMWQTVSSRSQQ